MWSSNSTTAPLLFMTITIISEMQILLLFEEKKSVPILDTKEIIIIHPSIHREPLILRAGSRGNNNNTVNINIIIINTSDLITSLLRILRQT